MILLSPCKVYSVCLISFFIFFELFTAFMCANINGSLVNSFLGTSNFYLIFSFTSSSDSSSGMSGKYSDFFRSVNPSLFSDNTLELFPF